MDPNLKKFGSVIGLSLKDRELGTPPASPVEGDRCIVVAAATGSWSGRSSQIAVRIGGTREFHAPRVDWLCFIEHEALLSVYNTTGRSPGIAI